MGLDNLVPNKQEIELGGKTWELRFPARAFRQLQELYGGWTKAWKALAESYEGDINYDVLIDFLFIGINNTNAPKEKIREWVDELYQDELVPIVLSIRMAANKYLPETKDAEPDPTK